MLCIFGDQTFGPIAWAFKKHTAVSQRSIEAEVISFDCGLRMEGLLALALWETEIDVLELLVFRAGGDPSRQLKPTRPSTHRNPLIMFHHICTRFRVNLLPV